MRRTRKKEPVKSADKPKAIERIGELLEMPTYGLTDTPHFEMVGNRELMVENCKGVIEYTDEQIRFSAGRFLVSLKGRGLYLKSMNDSSLLICGTILSMEFLM